MSRRVSQRKVYNTFIGGLVTEATEINFPDNASSNELNFELLKDGSRVRRKGVDIVNSDMNFTTIVFDNTDIIYNNYEWRDVDGRPETTYIVVQSGKSLFFYKDSLDIANNRHIFAIPLYLSGMEIDSGTAYEDLLDTSPCQFANGDGKLFVAGKYINPFVVLYNTEADSFTITILEVRERDFKGIDDGLAVDETPTTLSVEHDYNLNNQGWGTVGGSNARLTYFTAKAAYPSKAMSWRYGKIVNPTTGIQEFNVPNFDEVEFGNTPAPNGHYTVGAFSSQTLVGSPLTVPINTWSIAGNVVTIDIGPHLLVAGNIVTITSNTYVYLTFGGNSCGLDPSNSTLNGTYTITGVTANTIDIIHGPIYNFDFWCNQFENLGQLQSSSTSVITNDIPVRPRVVGFFAGRAFWSGVSYSGYSNKIWYSQIMEISEKQAGDCFQVADPTAEFLNELLDTDGGVIVMQSMGTVIAMEAIGASILVLCTNGVWEVTGGDAGYFTAKSIRTNKLTSFGCISASSIINAGDKIAYWSEQGIVVLTVDDIVGYKATSLTDNTIKTKYLDIVDKKFAVGRYNKVANTIVWVYSNTGDGYQHKFNRVLVFDLKIGAIYEYEVNPYETLISGVDANYITGLTVTDYYDSATNYINFTLAVDSEVQFGALNNDNHVDFISWDGVGVEEQGFLETGYELVSSPSLSKQSQRLSVFFKRTEKNWVDNGSGGVVLDNESGCVLSGKWDYSTSNVNGKVSKPYQIYNIKRLVVPVSTGPFDNGTDVTVVKVKVRGNGDSLTLRFETQPGKRCHILGWVNVISEETDE